MAPPISKKSTVILTAMIAFAALLAAGCGTVATRSPAPADGNVSTSVRDNKPASIHLAFGNPSGATTDPVNKNNYLVIGSGSAFSYNDSRGTVNWISWRTTRDDLGDALKRPDFRPDPRLPGSFTRIGYFDYVGSGYDRGHMVPSADRFADKLLNEETFMMTNIVPQTSALNQYPWQKFESYVRSEARKRNGYDVYQIAGVYGADSRFKNKVTVPTNCWKIVVLIPRGEHVSSIAGKTRVIAVDMPNKPGIENIRWERYKTTVRAIEENTGYDFFSDLSKELQDQLETRMEIKLES